MFYLGKAVLNVRRHKLKSLLAVLVCTLIVLFMFLYIGGVQANLQQLAGLPKAIPVYARVSNLNGTMNSGGLLIAQKVIEGLENSPHVSELRYTVQMGAALGRISEGDVASMGTGDLTFPLTLGVNALSASPSLSAEDIDFLDGQGPELLEGDEALCIIRDQEMERHGLNVGDSIWITLFYPSYPKDRYDLTYHWLGTYQVKIAGAYSEMWDAGEDNKPPQIVLPSKWIRKLYEQRGVMFFADSVNFRVADPLQLNSFKAKMKGLHLMSVISQAQHSHRGIALTVNDETFVRAASRLMDNIRLMRVFTPFICVTVGLVGFVVSYMLLQSRKPEIAVMRSLGVSRKSCFVLLFVENAALNLLGGMMGMLCAALLSEISIMLIMVVIGLFFICYMAGTAVALKLLERFSVMAVLSSLE
jgi:ABC-type antimicrobial peptide transport system, permease component